MTALSTVDARAAPVSVDPLSTWLVAAQQRSLTHDQRLDTLSLTALRKGIPDVPVDEVITDARISLTIDGASSLQIDLHDPLWLIERSGILANSDVDGRLASIVVTVDLLRFRLSASRRRTADILTLEFEDEAKALLDDHNRPTHASRNQVTRAEFIAWMVAEVKARDLIFVSPEAHRRQAIKRPDLPQVRPHGTTGFDDGTKLVLKQFDGATHQLDAAQMRNAATALATAQLDEASPRATMALAEACIVEAPMFSNPAGGDSSSVGILQLLNTHLGGSTSTNGGRRDVELVCHLFLTKGFAGQGGAIDLARQHPGWTAGQIAQAVQGSAFPDRYDEVHDSAKKVIDAYNGAAAGSTSQVLRFKSFEFTRGLPGKKETSWQAATRLAEQVNWRFFTVGGICAFVNDDYLLSQPAQLVLDARDDQGNWQLPDGLLELPGYDINHGKVASEVTLRAVANRWSVVPGEVVVLRNMGSASGRWIVQSFDMSLLDATTASITLVKPLPPRLEPAAETFTVATGPDSVAQGAQAAVAWAKSRIGHYREEFGHNRGAELDLLERKVGMVGAPWCAIFATTALIHGGLTREVRTAAVADLNAWCKAGTHGLTRGYRATPQVGDLMTFGDDHVAIVEKVDKGGRGVTIIEGNNGRGTVGERSVLNDTGAFIRPDWPS
jgi:hypothetical protein